MEIVMQVPFSEVVTNFRQSVDIKFSEDEKSRDLILKSLGVAEQFYKDDFKLQGGHYPYVVHPVSVAAHLLDISSIATKNDSPLIGIEGREEIIAPAWVIAATILHDIHKKKWSRLSKYRKSQKEDILRKCLGNEYGRITKVIDLVHGLSKNENKMEFFKFESKTQKVNDLETVAAYIKILDRYHLLMNTLPEDLGSFPLLTSMAKEVREKYLPFAARLGTIRLRYAIEDKVFQILEENDFNSISRQIQNKRKRIEKSNVLEDFCETLEKNILRPHFAKVDGDYSGKILNVGFYWKNLFSLCYRVTHGEMRTNREWDVGEAITFFVITASKEVSESVLLALESYSDPINIQKYENWQLNGRAGIHAMYIPHQLGIAASNKDFPLIKIIIRTYEEQLSAEQGITVEWLNNAIRLSNEQVKNEFKTQGLHRVITKDGETVYLQQGSTLLDFAYTVLEVQGDSRIVPRYLTALRNFRPVLDLGEKLEDGDFVEVLSPVGFSEDYGFADVDRNIYHDLASLKSTKDKIDDHYQSYRILRLSIQTIGTKGIAESILHTVLGLDYSIYRMCAETLPFTSHTRGVFYLEVLGVEPHRVSRVVDILSKLRGVIGVEEGDYARDVFIKSHSSGKMDNKKLYKDINATMQRCKQKTLFEYFYTNLDKECNQDELLNHFYKVSDAKNERNLKKLIGRLEKDKIGGFVRENSHKYTHSFKLLSWSDKTSPPPYKKVYKLVIEDNQ